jgi:hypothetical protein
MGRALARPIALVTSGVSARIEQNMPRRRTYDRNFASASYLMLRIEEAGTRIAFVLGHGLDP